MGGGGRREWRDREREREREGGRKKEKKRERERERESSYFPSFFKGAVSFAPSTK